CVLRAIVALYGEQRTPAAVIQTTYSTPLTTPVRLEPKRPTPDHLKQYGHFVMDNVKVNAMGVSCIIKRIRFMYKGDGIDADVAKCALTNGESEKKTIEAPKALNDLLEKLDKGCDGLKAVPKLTSPTCVPSSTCVSPVEYSVCPSESPRPLPSLAAPTSAVKKPEMPKAANPK